jgi:hypothetical protein
MFLKKLVAVLLIFIITATLVASPEMVARQTFAAILGGFAGSVSGAVIGTVLGGLINPTGWGDLVGLILGYIVGAPVGSSLTTLFWSAGRLEGSPLLSIVGSVGGVAFPYALSGLIANFFPADDFNPSGIFLMISLPLYSAFGAVMGYNYPRLISGDPVVADLSTTVK